MQIIPASNHRRKLLFNVVENAITTVWTVAFGRKLEEQIDTCIA